MNNKKFFASMILILLVIINFRFIKTNAQVSEEYLNNALKNTSSNIEEIGLSTNYKTNNDGKKECDRLIKDMSVNDSRVTSNNNNSYCVEFNDNNTSGYIESIKKSTYYDISINIKIFTDKNKINELKRKVTESIKCKSICYIYIKAKSKMKNINEISRNIKNYFTQKGARNLKTTKMNNILSTTMYTGRYDYIFDDNERVDLNCAVCRYDTGNYIIIGTPILNINY